MNFRSSLVPTHRIGESLLSDALPRDLCVYTLTLHPENFKNPLGALSFLSSYATQKKICEHAHDQATLISYLKNKKDTQHVCPECDKEMKVGQSKKKQKTDEGVLYYWTRKDSQFTTEKISRSQELVLTHEDLFRIRMFCGPLSDDASGYFDRREGNYNMIAAFDITDKESPEIVGFAFYQISHKNIALMDPEDLEELFEEEGLPSLANFTKETTEIILEGINSREMVFEEEDALESSPDYGLYMKALRNLLGGRLVTFFSKDEVAIISHWILTVDVEDEQEEGSPYFETGPGYILFVNLICADPEYVGMGISKGIFRRLKDSIISIGNHNDAISARIVLQPVNERRGMYMSFGFGQDPENEENFTTEDLLSDPSSLDVTN